MKTIVEKLNEIDKWIPPVLPSHIPFGDMPGDKVQINEIHLAKANVIFSELVKQMKLVLERTGQKKAVVTVCGGSGVGKTEIASLLAYYFTQAGIGSYTLSGDNYPHRIPKYNDAERLRIFREAALKGMLRDEEYSAERWQQIRMWQTQGMDANWDYVQEHPWFASYLKHGKAALENYLGTSNEIAFQDIEEIVRQFKTGEDLIWLKRMGRGEEDLWYDQIDFSEVEVLIIEWTHGNSDYYEGVDIPVLLNSTPKETLEHRRERNRDGSIDSPFTSMVLGIEQNLLQSQAKKAKIILSKQGELLSFKEYEELMGE